MKKISLTLNQLLAAGLHIGHHKSRWNPRMSSYLFGTINDINILNLEQTILILRKSLNLLKEVAINRGKILLITNNTKNKDVQVKSNKIIKYYTNNWINGFLTNWRKVYALQINKKKNIFRIPDVLIVLNSSEYQFAIKEAMKLSIPIISIIDSNSNPLGITFPIPGNNSSIQSIQLLSNLINNAVIDGLYSEKKIFKYKYNIFNRI